MFIVSVIVFSNCHILQFLHQMFNVSVVYCLGPQCNYGVHIVDLNSITIY